MSLPEQHRTARFKSLPKGLKAKAEAIINKKFGLGVATDLETAQARVAEKMKALGKDREGVAFKVIALSARNYYIQYEPSQQRYRVYTECPDCDEDHTEYIHDEYVMGSNGIGRAWVCYGCKAKITLFIRTEHLPKQPERVVRSEIRVGDRVVVKRKGILNVKISLGDMAEYIGNDMYRMINGACAGQTQFDGQCNSFERFQSTSHW